MFKLFKDLTLYPPFSILKVFPKMPVYAKEYDTLLINIIYIYS